MRIARNVAIIFAGLSLLACSYNTSLVRTSYKVLAASQASYDTSMKVAKDLKDRDLLEVNEVFDIRNAADTYYKTHNTTAEALAKYVETKSAEGLEQLEKQLGLISEALIEFLKVLNPYIGGD